MMDPTLITKIAAAGAMGVSIYCIYKVYDLLKNEQDKVKPRPVIIRTIYASMIFALVMTLLSLGIEVLRNENNMKSIVSFFSGINELKGNLNTIVKENYYSVNKNGNPKEIKLIYNNQNYVLSKAFPKTSFENNELKLKRTEEGKYLTVKENIGNEVVFGYISNSDLKSKKNDLFPEYLNESLTAKELWNLGLLYTPDNAARLAEYNLKKDKSLANDYLIKLISLKDDEYISLQENAIKLLTQPVLMSRLNQSQYDKLIHALTSGNLIQAPYDRYTLAQVYLNRSWQKWNTDSKSDKEKYKEFLKEYKSIYEGLIWIKDQEKYKDEYKWYLEAKSIY